MAAMASSTNAPAGASPAALSLEKSSASPAESLPGATETADDDLRQRCDDLESRLAAAQAELSRQERERVAEVAEMNLRHEAETERLQKDAEMLRMRLEQQEAIGRKLSEVLVAGTDGSGGRGNDGGGLGSSSIRHIQGDNMSSNNQRAVLPLGGESNGGSSKLRSRMKKMPRAKKGLQRLRRVLRSSFTSSCKSESQRQGLKDLGSSATSAQSAGWSAAMSEEDVALAAITDLVGGISASSAALKDRQQEESPPTSPNPVSSCSPGEPSPTSANEEDSLAEHQRSGSLHFEEILKDPYAADCADNTYERSRRIHRRVSREKYRTAERRTSVDVDALEADDSFRALVRMERFKDWALSLRRLDPRYQILTYFDDVARDGGILCRPSVGGREGSAVELGTTSGGKQGVFGCSPPRAQRRSCSNSDIAQRLEGGWTTVARGLSICSEISDGASIVDQLVGIPCIENGSGLSAHEDTGGQRSSVIAPLGTSSLLTGEWEEPAAPPPPPPCSFSSSPQPRQGRRRGPPKTCHRPRTTRQGSRSSAILHPELQSPILRLFDRAGVFTVWRPCSLDAIRAMMTGAATGKGLDVKGKSAKKGRLSGYVPFVQIHNEFDKDKVARVSAGGGMRVFYATRHGRDAVMDHLRRFDGKDGTDTRVDKIDAYSRGGCWGLECPQSLFWDACVLSRSITREPGSDLDTGRPSAPAFQDMNLKTVRIKETNDDHTTVVWQCPSTGPDGEEHDPLDPRTLLMAYEEKGRVLPVVSDFDCFIVGTRGVRYNQPLPPEQVKLLRWSVSQVESILDGQWERVRKLSMESDKRHPTPIVDKSWTAQWLELLKRDSDRSDAMGEECMSSIPLPRYGFGDPTSYAIMGHGIDRLECGAVRHGAECFNYKFPQEIDDQFLVISDSLPGKVPWKYVSELELRELLIKKVDEGFAFPINPKWILCDPGWKDVYKKLLSSSNKNIRSSMNVWFPPDSGVRERIEEVCRRHPRGYAEGRLLPKQTSSQCCGTEAMDLAELQLRRYLALQRAKRKLRMVMLFRRLNGDKEESDSEQSPKRNVCSPPPAA